MHEDDGLLTALHQRLVGKTESTTWESVAPLLAAFERIARSGSVALVKVDGVRKTPDLFTIVLSQGALGDKFFRKDGDDLRTLLREAIRFYIDETTSHEVELE